jgi:enoyl-[acyl-carrier protein] reductase I
MGRRAKPLGESLGADLFLECSVDVPGDIDKMFDTIKEEWGSLDFVVHALAFSDRNELNGHYVDTTRDNFINTMVISCFSFTEVAKRAAELMPDGGSMITLSYSGSTRVVPRYNVMGVAKAALEASVRYLAADLGPKGIRVNTLSPGPMRTMAGAAIADGRTIFKYQEMAAPLRRNPTLEEVGGSAVYLLSDYGAGTTGQNLLVDCGASSVAMPQVEDLK